MVSFFKRHAWHHLTHLKVGRSVSGRTHSFPKHINPEQQSSMSSQVSNSSRQMNSVCYEIGWSKKWT